MAAEQPPLAAETRWYSKSSWAVQHFEAVGIAFKIKERAQVSSKKCPHCGLYSTEAALRCDCGYDFASMEMKSSYLQAPKSHSTRVDGAAKRPEPLPSSGGVRWIQWIC
jgi:hypothetical protein